MSESYNQYGLGPTTLCAHGLPNLDTRCPYCERDALRAEVEQLRAERDGAFTRYDALLWQIVRRRGAMSDPLKVKCPYCAAKPDYACTSAYDYRVVRTHAARVRAAEREERGKEKGNG